MTPTTQEQNKTPEEVRQEIERAREQISSSAIALRRELQAKTDWREWVRRSPVNFVVGAFAMGLLFGIRLFKRR